MILNHVSGLFSHYAPGSTIEVRDEEWLVTGVARSTDGWRLQARGLSPYVRDHTATFYTGIDDVNLFAPEDVAVIPDTSANFRDTRLWAETMMRQTPVPLYQDELSVSREMLMDPLSYQLSAVRKTLSADNIRPRMLIADAVGLGKTLEIGLILSELIRRGRGERILVVTPRHVLEQMQHELWTRFAIPLVRLDSLGIQKVRQKLPASRNPFTYFPRVIVSLDTIKSPRYTAQLKKVHWDAVVIDEVHNATNAGTKNNQLARTLAPTTEALLLASATPHNGNPESFKEILRLLDPTSVLPDGTIDTDAAQRLIIRRHRNSAEVAAEVGSRWAQRKPPQNILVEASDEENAVADEIAATWTHPDSGNNPAGDQLFPWTLVKAFLSSPAALLETVHNRLGSIGKGDTTQREALERLEKLAQQVTPENSNKYAALINLLESIGVEKGSAERVVVFSERVGTLRWLQENLRKHLSLKKDAIAILHGGMSDQEQMAVIDSFKREDSPIRVLVTGDVASEGVNLHQQCNQLIHFDIPWSLIRIQQRNGRIDRYGQTKPPVITTLLLDTQNSEALGEVHVFTRLVEREFEANQVIGDAAPLMGEHSIRGEEDKVRDILRGTRDLDQEIMSPTTLASAGGGSFLDEIDQLLNLGNIPGAEAQPAAAHGQEGEASLYARELDYLHDALHEAFHDIPQKSPLEGGVSLAEYDNGIAELTPPADLRSRLDLLPQEYLSTRRVKERLTLATTSQRGNERLKAALQGDSSTTWPSAHYLGPLHPVLSWAADRALASMSRHEIPVATGSVTEPTVLLLGTLSNRRGQVVSRAFVTATDSEFGIIDAEAIPNPVAWMQAVGLGPGAVKRIRLTESENEDSPVIEKEFVPRAVKAARGALTPMMDSASKDATERIARWSDRAEAWERQRAGESRATRSLLQSEKLIAQEKALADALAPERELVRPVLVVVPEPKV